MPPLVSILIPAYNAEHWIEATIQSALGQTWPNTEIIVVDDGSDDRTLAVARRFSAKNVTIVAQDNQGASAARNKAFSLSQGEFIQWLDADDLLPPDKIEKQVAVAQAEGNERVLFSSGWGEFMYRCSKARFTPTTLWHDLSPTEWLLRKMDENLHMQTATWLVGRYLTQAAGPWDTRLSLDDDGEYFSRVVMASQGVRFVPGAKVFYRQAGSDRLSNIDQSSKKLESQFLSMQLHVRYLLSLEQSDRSRQACRNYLQTWFICFYPERADLVAKLQELARTIGGDLDIPTLSWKYFLIEKLFGFGAAKHVQSRYNRLKSSLMAGSDRMMCLLVPAKKVS